MNNKKTEIYFVRHGESIGNLKGICLGHTDLDITDLGYKQAYETAKALEEIKFSAIYSSDLIRAMNTARPHSIMHNLEIIPSRDFRELYFGDWENRSVDYLIDKYKEDFTVGWRRIFGTFTPPGGESVVQMADRIEAAVVKIAQSYSGTTILVVTHAAAIRSLWGKISGLPADRWAENPFPSNASYSIAAYEGGKLSPVIYSVDYHLGDLATNIKH